MTLFASKEDMPRCSNGATNSEISSKLDSHAFLAKLSKALKRHVLLMAGFQHDFFVLF
ncbi:hypothetical protein [Paraburkholderia haematera]|uniref:Uncharacterized protein n=1 Tax=Paraburkholderia haematera TaxID=2793077 RepID=A0ABM8QFM2_9BURK|nr:hypothetical protein [Paraburkholderia haematera]CAE6694599.1 hypothetical protein R69888_00404 [Paraburkholderia haematera]